ncbi:S9 family peptidase, partial [Enterococcus sp. S181_ASV_20]|nr:S9 family peptidase [Enterococcus sp. S181_ASV_20]
EMCIIDRSLAPEKVAVRPLFFCHGTEDEKVPYQHTADFIKANPQANITFVSAEERHFVQIATMDQICLLSTS